MAHESDRDAAVALVQAAFAVGEIVEADRDKRIEQLRMAQTLDEIRMVTHDIRSAAPEVDYPTLQEIQATKDRPPRSKAVILVPLAAVLVAAIALVGGLVALIQNSSGDDGSGVLGIGSEEADVLSEEGYQDLLAAVRDETGGSTAFSAVLYPTYAVVELPVDETSQREEYWYWDGEELTNNGTKSTSSFPRTDLAQIDPALVVELVEQVRTKVEEPTSWYAIVRAPDSDRAVVWAYASNEYNESEYVGARRDGTITYDSTEN